MSIFQNLLGSLFDKADFLNGNKKVKNQIKDSVINAPVQQAETIVNNGPIQRHLTLSIKNDLLSKISKGDLIMVTPNTKDRETLNFSAEIAQYLKSQNLNVSLNSNGSFRSSERGVSLGDDIELFRSDKKVNPNPNIGFWIPSPNCQIIVN